VREVGVTRVWICGRVPPLRACFSYVGNYLEDAEVRQSCGLFGESCGSV